MRFACVIVLAIGLFTLASTGCSTLGPCGGPSCDNGTCGTAACGSGACGGASCQTGNCQTCNNGGACGCNNGGLLGRGGLLGNGGLLGRHHGGYCGQCGHGLLGGRCNHCGFGHGGANTPYTSAYQGPGGPGAGSYSYPYYTTRGPRDFLMSNPPPIGY